MTLCQNIMVYQNIYILIMVYHICDNMKKEEINNIFFQSDELAKIKKGSLRGIYLQSKERFVKNKNMVEICGDTTQGEYNPNYVKWRAYIEYDSELNDTYIVVVMGD